MYVFCRRLKEQATISEWHIASGGKNNALIQILKMKKVYFAAPQLLSLFVQATLSQGLYRYVVSGIKNSVCFKFKINTLTDFQQTFNSKRKRENIHKTCRIKNKCVLINSPFYKNIKNANIFAEKNSIYYLLHEPMMSQWFRLNLCSKV